MRQRCTNRSCPDFKNYGGRGISYARRWEAFSVFIADMGEPGPMMTLERKDNNADYGPENCMWVSRAVQNQNRRNVRRFVFGGRSLTLAEWSRETGIGRVTLLKRIQRGLTIEQALTVKLHAKPKAKKVPANVAVEGAASHDRKETQQLFQKAVDDSAATTLIESRLDGKWDS